MDKNSKNQFIKSKISNSKIFNNKLFNNKIFNLFKSYFIKYIAIIIFIIVWQFLSITGFFDENFVSSFTTTAYTMLYLIFNGIIIEDTLYTFLRITIGVFLAILVAIPLGFLVAGFYKKLEISINPLFRFLEQLNPFGFFHFIILLTLLNELSIVLVIFWAALWPLLNNTVSGARNIKEEYIKIAKASNFDNFDIFWKVQLRASLANIFTGLRLSVIFAFLAVFGVEMMGMTTGKGLGYFIMTSQMAGNVPYIWAGVVTVTLLSVFIIKIINQIEKYFVKEKIRAF